MIEQVIIGTSALFVLMAGLYGLGYIHGRRAEARQQMNASNERTAIEADVFRRFGRVM